MAKPQQPQPPSQQPPPASRPSTSWTGWYLPADADSLTAWRRLATGETYTATVNVLRAMFQNGRVPDGSVFVAMPADETLGQVWQQPPRRGRSPRDRTS